MDLPYSNLQLKHWNPGATMPLILPVHVVCNTPEDELHENIRENSALPGREWIKSEPPHGLIAVLVGSGPSLVDDLEKLREFREVEPDCRIFAMNGAAKYLHENGLTADYQVMIDPREATRQLIGPARGHLIASQCHPSVFEALPDARLHHLQIEGIEDDIPDAHPEHALLGGAASVGNTACVLAYVLGYRTLHLYGYDSSHRDTGSHAFRQPMNDGEPCCVVVWNEREYRTSLTMKMQAEKAQDTLRLLEGEGVKVHVHGSGLLPDMWNTPPEDLPEREKYVRMWSIPGYRRMSPGEDAARAFLDVVQPDGLVIDFGAGTGRGALAIAKAGNPVVLVDFAANCRDNEALHLPFVEHDLTEPLSLRAPYGYCTDVMEHIPPHQVDAVIRNIMATAAVVYFQISTVPDRFGAVINQRLHLSVHPHAWWLATFERLGYRVRTHENLGIASAFVIERD